MLREMTYALYLTGFFYAIIFVSLALGLHSYPETTFTIIGPAGTFLLLFGTVNNVMEGLKGR